MPDETTETTIRVFAEERAPGELLLTWEWTGAAGVERDAEADARAVAATLGVVRGVSGTTVTPEGVTVLYDAAVVDKARIAGALRGALRLEGDLRARANDLLKRAPTYASLARSLALDERVSPVPEVARQAATRKRGATRATPLRLIPGFAFLHQLYTLLPVLRALSSWSREASPEVVEEHLAAVGLSREQLDRDMATAQEGMLLAREKTAGTASRAAERAKRARDTAREWAERRNQPPPPRRYEP